MIACRWPASQGFNVSSYNELENVHGSLATEQHRETKMQGEFKQKSSCGSNEHCFEKQYSQNKDNSRGAFRLIMEKIHT